MACLSQPHQYARAKQATFVAALGACIRFETVSAQPRAAREMLRCARWLVRHLRGIGLAASQIVPTRGHPAVLARWHHAPGQPTVLIYGHYDVQPADPLGEWQSPPFHPIVRGNNLFGRGGSDDKGQIFCHLAAIECYLRTLGRLPVNVTVLIEGEEEIGSPHMEELLRRHQGLLAADVAVISDSAMTAPDKPALAYALRGSLSLELEVSGPRTDLHSGNFGGAVHNPAQALCEIVARLHDADGRIAIPGFYDRVRSVTAHERARLRGVTNTAAEIARESGVPRLWGDRAFTASERTTLRPALTVNGIRAGYQAMGVKAVIPSRAVAKLNLRLVVDQDPVEIDRLFRRFVSRITPPTVRCAVRTMLGARPAHTDTGHPAMRAAAASVLAGFGHAPRLIRLGGTIPVVSMLQEIIGCPTILMGFALRSDNPHAPNEKFHLPNFFRGIATCIELLARSTSPRHARGGAVGCAA